VTTAAPIRTLIVDDEPLARERVRQMLQSVPDFQILGESSDGERAVKDILRLKPDLVFLDIQMPGLGGFEVIQTLGADRVPVVIFVTAFDKYALKAFDVNAVDYLLKPYSRDRFEHALKGAVKEIQRRRLAGHSTDLSGLLSTLREAGDLAPRILVRTAQRVDIVSVADIDWVGAAGNYVELHAGDQVYLLRETMAGMERRLPPGDFVRIHRSSLVRVERVESLQPLASGDFQVTLAGGTRLAMSRRYREALTSRFQR
jgi:two-component system LytT family response regulator